MIKYGIKIWSINKDWFHEAIDLSKQGKIDFGELYIVPNSFELKELEVLKQMPFSVHAPHYTHGFNVFELSEEQINVFNNQVTKTADFLNSNFIILHPGVGKDRNIFKKNSSKLTDKRILMETMLNTGFVGKGGNRLGEGVRCFGYSKEQLKFIHDECGFDICLDLSHVTASAAFQKIKYKDFIKSLIVELSPSYFHISGQHEDSEEDEHLNISDGDIDMKWIKTILTDLAETKDIYLVFETPKTGVGLENDIKNIEFFKNLKI